jgi:hypothetical protein
LKRGDVVVRRAIEHAWEHRSGESARMAFIVIDAAFASGLAALVGGAAITS